MVADPLRQTAVCFGRSSFPTSINPHSAGTETDSRRLSLEYIHQGRNWSNEPDGCPFLWHFTNKCHINLPPFARSGSSLELVSLSADIVTVRSGPEEVSCTEQGVQTETETVSLAPLLMMSDKISTGAGPDEVILVDQFVQIAFSDFSTTDALLGSESESDWPWVHSSLPIRIGLTRSEERGPDLKQLKLSLDEDISS